MIFGAAGFIYSLESCADDVAIVCIVVVLVLVWCCSAVIVVAML